MSDDSDQTQSLNQVYRKVIEWKISEKEDDEEEDRDSAYNSSIRSHFQSVLSSSSLSQSLRKGKVPAARSTTVPSPASSHPPVSGFKGMTRTFSN